MSRPRWSLRTLLVATACAALLIAGALKGWRYVALRDQIGQHARAEAACLARYHEEMSMPARCGNIRKLAPAYLAMAAELRARRLTYERQLRQLW